jgi:hypothetical protein
MTCKLADESLESGKFLDPEAAGEGGQGRQHLRHIVVFQSVNQIRNKRFSAFFLVRIQLRMESIHPVRKEISKWHFFYHTVNQLE